MMRKVVRRLSVASDYAKECLREAGGLVVVAILGAIFWWSVLAYLSAAYGMDACTVVAKGQARVYERRVLWHDDYSQPRLTRIVIRDAADGGFDVKLMFDEDVWEAHHVQEADWVCLFSMLTRPYSEKWKLVDLP